MSNQAGNAVIDNTNFTVTLEIPGGVDLSAVAIQNLELSSFATADKATGDVLDLNDDAIIQVTAEDGSIHDGPFIHLWLRQHPNSKMEI